MNDPAGLWERVSTGQQDEANQHPDNARWCESHDYDIKALYPIHGASAHKGNKKFDEAWEKVLEDFRTGLIKVLVVWRLSRLDRKLAATRMISEVVALGGRVEFVQQPHLNNLSTMAGRISLKVEEEIAFAESEEKTQRIKASVQHVRINGAFYGRIPYGYETEGTRHNKQLIPTDEGRKFIPLIFDRIIKGESFETIAAWMQTQTNRKFAKHTIEVIAHNPVYIGHATDVNGKVVHECERLIDAAVFASAQKSISRRPKRGPNKNDKALLTSVLYCPDCGGDSPMYRAFPGYKKKDGTLKSTPYYRCSGRQATVKGEVIPRKGCGNMIKVEIADKIINKNMSAWTTEIYEIKVTAGHDWEAEIKDVKFRISRLDQESDDYDDKHAELRAELKDYRTREEVPDTIERVKSGVTFGDRWKTLDDAGKRKFLADEKVKIYLSKKNHIRLVIDESADAFAPSVWNDDGTLNYDDGSSFGWTGEIYHCISLPDWTAYSR